MKFVAKVITFLFYFQCISIISGQQTFVIDGDEVDISAAPYMLSLRRLGHHICGASVISKYWTITAAHCLIKTVPSQVTLRGGNRNRFLGQLFNAERIVLHPNFNINYDFDVAVLKTVQQLIEKDNLIRPIALGLQGTYSEAGSLGTVAGWGITEETDSSLSENLKVTTVRFIAHNDCNATLASFGGTTINNLCTLGTIGTTTPDFCLGDEGGPLIQDDRIVGIASWSPRCGNLYPSVFTRITIVSIRGFIYNITGL